MSEDVDEDAVAFSREGAPLFWEIVTEWDHPEGDRTFHGWLGSARADIRPHLRSNAYVNLSTDDGPAWRRGVWGSPDKYARLVCAKTEWDPDNMFRYNKNIRPDDLRAAPRVDE
ncbi:BBE domain-containing protein [Streptomyces gardneri]|nr:BBE domain-containing protein [Streptomyces gardneri]MBF6208752.1 BBE domain-containing protein [Streptomyces gardneri]